MACSHHDALTALVASQVLPGHGECEPNPAQSKQGRTRIKPGMGDSVHVDPEHVWGDEGPVNE